MHTVNSDWRQGIGVIDSSNLLARNQEQSVVSPDPNVSLIVLRKRANEVVGQAIAAGKGVKCSIFIAEKAAAFHSDPQAVVARHQQTEHAVLAELRSVLAIARQASFAIQPAKPAAV